MSNIGEQIQNRLLISSKVIASARAHASNVAEALAARAVEFEGLDATMTASDFKRLILFFASGLEKATIQLRDAEQTVAAEKADDLAIRTSRDMTAAELHTLIARLRAAIDEHLGEDGVGTYGLSEDSPRTPRKLVEYTYNVLQLLDTFPLQVSSPFGSQLDSAAVIAVLKPKAALLQQIVADDDREYRELEDAFARRNRAIVTWTDTYQGTASALEGLYRFAGYMDLAGKVRPTLRRVRGDDAGAEASDDANIQ